MAPDKTLLIITGPTAVGKTALTLALAERLGAEVVSADSLLLYRGMDIGTAKPTAAERARVPHHLIDIAAPDAPLDVTRYVPLARVAVDDITARGRPVMVTGGSGFYLKAFYAPIADAIEPPESVTEEVRKLEARGLSAMLERLRALNPGGFAGLHTENPRRVARALERCLTTGRSIAELHAEFAAQPGPFADFRPVIVLLERPKDALEARIRRRAETMLANGLVEEVRHLRAANFEANPSAARAIGYREVLRHLDGDPDLATGAQLVDAIHLSTRRLAAKQRKWFRHQIEPDLVLDLESIDTEAALDSITALWTTAQSPSP